MKMPEFIMLLVLVVGVMTACFGYVEKSIGEIVAGIFLLSVSSIFFLKDIG